MTNHSADTDPILLADNAALVVIDVQQGFDDSDFWGERDNPDAEKNIAALLDAWQATGRPVAMVQHRGNGSPLGVGTPGYELKPEVAQARWDVHITKTVNSAFYGTPDLKEWLDEHGIRQIVTVGIMTNVCVETTARMGGNLGYDVLYPVDATHTFAMAGPDGVVIPATDLSRATVASLHHNRFARVVGTADLLAASGA
ncbi:cysteine hydrolase family protein [Kitasatospora nipponensis]|uniref:Cysteine hydrolase family protein n=1 Tax=Kitasatospora nipponensis TaxID=258049 RepID=A0ABN1WNY1_9ACTN